MRHLVGPTVAMREHSTCSQSPLANLIILRNGSKDPNGAPMDPCWRFSQLALGNYASLVSKLANESKRYQWRTNSSATLDTSSRNGMLTISHTVRSVMVAAEVSIGQKVLGTVLHVEMIFAVKSATINSKELKICMEYFCMTTSLTLSSN